MVAVRSHLGGSSRPDVVAALGRPDPTLTGRLLAASPGLGPVVATPALQVWGGPGLATWTAGDTRGWTWAASAPEVRPTSWQSAANEACAPGVTVCTDGGVVHADGLALQDLYARRVGDAVYLSTRLHPLMVLDDGPLTPDVSAWGAILTVGAPVGAATPVREVRRLTAGEAWTVTAHGTLARRTAPPLWDDVPSTPTKPAEMTEVIAAAIPAGDDPLVVTLSGGWDSRVLTSLALRRGHPVEAWTTYQYHPREKDLVWAVRVADSLGVPQRMVLPHGRDWAAHQAAVRRRLDFQTWMHTWIFALTEELRGQPLPVVDGGYGDLLLRADMAGKAAAGELPWPSSLFFGMGGKRLDFVSTQAAPLLLDATMAAYAELAATVADRPNRETLLQLLTRQNRAVTSAARQLVGPETEVWMPFTHPAVVRAALSVPLADKQQHAYYREVLDTACGPEGLLRSSNDRGAHRQKMQGAFLQPAMITSLMDTVRRSERARSLLGPLVAGAMEGDDGPTILRRRLRPVDTLAWAALLADFEQEYADRLDWSAWPL
ncbi:asparagine synthase-related protein [Nocardioides sp.]|uniref:asparagine synthase-related protein n=1 Tax=Nocardioides sp. TaxID=35761 RepID=UPI003528737A